tara:strand:- start:21 stop:389 length:369 start_codon:yes stop_codon:yes gene_type:complete
MANLITKVILYLEDKGKTIDESSDDFRFTYVIQNDSDGKGDYLKAWNDKSIAEPSESTLNSFESAANARDSLKTVQGKRKINYPDIAEQLDLLYKDMLADKGDKTGDWFAAVKKVKDDNPKP